MRRIQRALPLAALCLVGALLTGCGLLQPASPTTTVTDASGHETTLSWADFPGEQHHEPADVLAAPRSEQVERFGDELLDELQRSVDDVAPGLAWETGAEGGVSEHGGNGYGGPSLHRTYNSPDVSTAEVPDDWDALTAALDAELAQHGFEAIIWDFEREPFAHQTAAEHDAEVVEVHGSLDPAEMWRWLGSASDGAMWVSVILVDVDRGVGAPPDVDRQSPQLLALMVGATVIDAADEAAYRDGTAPFEGLERPEATHSD
ncbi:hypothetical protein [Agrococcus citreus]|uniref:Lipoprotein n=1 Tax=Agrococcus citreus TaxID=84643 RepID=A0ABN1YUD0_9MICO